jgi:hypothetical protein
VARGRGRVMLPAGAEAGRPQGGHLFVEATPGGSMRRSISPKRATTGAELTSACRSSPRWGLRLARGSRWDRRRLGLARAAFQPDGPQQAVAPTLTGR